MILQKQLNLDLEVKCKQFLKNVSVAKRRNTRTFFDQEHVGTGGLFTLQRSPSLLLVFAFN